MISFTIIEFESCVTKIPLKRDVINVLHGHHRLLSFYSSLLAISCCFRYSFLLAISGLGSLLTDFFAEAVVVADVVLPLGGCKCRRRSDGDDD